MQDGPYLAHQTGPWRVVSEGSTRKRATSLLIVRTGRIVTVPKVSSAGCSEFPAYSQVLLRQRNVTLGPFLLLLLDSEEPSGPDISADLSWSPMRADYLIQIPVGTSGSAYSL